MTVLSDETIRSMIATGHIGLQPFEPDNIQPASVDLRLGAHFQVMARKHDSPFIDPTVTQAVEVMDEVVLEQEDQPFVLHPGEFALATTVERVRLPAGIVARADGKSSLGRWGLLVHATAGFIDPGFDGQITLELANLAGLPMTLWPGMRIAQICFMRLDQDARAPYGSAGLGSKYQFQQGATGSSYWRNGTVA